MFRRARRPVIPEGAEDPACPRRRKLQPSEKGCSVPLGTLRPNLEYGGLCKCGHHGASATFRKQGLLPIWEQLALCSFGNTGESAPLECRRFRAFGNSGASPTLVTLGPLPLW